MSDSDEPTRDPAGGDRGGSGRPRRSGAPSGRPPRAGAPPAGRPARSAEGGRPARSADAGGSGRPSRPGRAAPSAGAGAGSSRQGADRPRAGSGRPDRAGARPERSERARRTAGRPAPLSEEEKAQIAARYDPRREKRRQEARVALPDDVEPQQLDKDVRTELRSLAKDTSDLVARHLVMTGRLLDEDPEQALVHARAARALAGRVGVVREATGIAAYHAGEWGDALSELRAARRITGRAEHLAVMADCERALGRPEKAVAYGDDPAVPSLEQADRVELVVVLAGARRDLGQADAAVLMLQDPAKRTTAKRPWAARLWYAYADALLDAGRAEQARDWFARVTDVDALGETDAVDRLLELDGVVLDGFDAEADAEADVDVDADGGSSAATELLDEDAPER